MRQSASHSDYVRQDEILRVVVNLAIEAAVSVDKRVTNPLQVVNLPHTVPIFCEAQ